MTDDGETHRLATIMATDGAGFFNPESDISGEPALERVRHTVRRFGVVLAVLFAALAALPAHAASPWDGTYECIRGDGYCENWFGELRVRDGRLSGALKYFLPNGGFLDLQVVGGRVGDDGGFKAAKLTFNSHSAFLQQSLDLKGTIWDAKLELSSAVRSYVLLHNFSSRLRFVASPTGAPATAANVPAVRTNLVVMDEGFVAVKSANVRAEPSIEADRVARLSKGEIVTVLGFEADWFLVAREGERLGFVFASLLAAEGSEAALAAVTPARPAVIENRDAVAVIIGNKAYTGDTPEVDYAYNDANAIKKYVIEVLGYREGNIIDIRDATLGDLQRVFGTKENARGRLFDFIREGVSDVTVFYSGHGVPGLQDNRGYLLPVDGDPNKAEITAYPLDVLQANLAKLPARSMQVFLDACFSGNSEGGMLIQATSGIGISPMLPQAPDNFAMLTAASGDQVASWDREAKHGLFTKHLLEALNGRADDSQYGNGDGKIALGEVKTYLDREMTFQARRRFGRDQNATMVGVAETELTRL